MNCELHSQRYIRLTDTTSGRGVDLSIAEIICGHLQFISPNRTSPHPAFGTLLPCRRGEGTGIRGAIYLSRRYATATESLIGFDHCRELLLFGFDRDHLGFHQVTLG